MLFRFRRAARDLSIKRKIMLIVVLSSGLALVLACAGFVMYDAVTFREATLENTETLVKIFGNNTAAALRFDDAAAANEVLAALAGEPHVITAVVYKEDRPFARYTRPGSSVPDPAHPPAQATSTFSGGLLELVRPIIANEQRLGMLYMITDLTALDDQLHRKILIAAALLVAAMIAAYLLASAFQPVISRPVFDLVNLTRRVSADRDYSMRVQPHSRDEIGALFDGFNDMLAQIQQRDSALQAAHGDLERRVVERTRELQEQIAVRLTAEKALQQQLTRISLLNQIASALSDRQDLDSIVRVVLAQLEEHLPVDFGSVSIFDSAHERLEVAAVRRRGRPPEAAHQSLAPFGPLDDALAGVGDCRAGQQVYFPDSARSPQPAMRRFASDQLRSVVAVPLMVERRFFGLLVVAREAAGAFTSGESEFLRMLGEQVAVAGSQAHLYTELQRAYTELRQSQRAMMQQERLRALGQMASGIAHDINNTLTPIVTFADILLESEPNLSDRARACLRNIQTAGDDISGIVARLREFYRPRDAQESHESVDLQSLLSQVADLTRPRWRDMPQARGIVIDLRVDFAPDVPRISGHPTGLRESFTNLILNAVDALPDGGTVTLRTRLRPDPATKTNSILVEVADTGVGMDENTRQRCLEPFFSTKGQRGTGLGLAMVYGVMERHSGRIEIESAPGAGTTMRLVFPASVISTAGSLHPFDEQGNKLRPLRVLCIDDEPTLRNVLIELFRLDGHDPVAADGAQAGIELFRASARAGRPYDVVVTDLGMPHIDGRQLAQMVKQESKSTPVILLTGWGRIMHDENDRPEAVDVVLSKPPRPAEMRQALRQLLGGGTNAK